MTLTFAELQFMLYMLSAFREKLAGPELVECDALLARVQDFRKTTAALQQGE